MQRFKRGAVITTTVAACLTGVSVGSASADPDKAKGTETIDADCGEDGIVTLQAQFNSSGVPTFNPDSAVRGRQLVLSSLDGRFYEGEFDEEPSGDPAGVFAQEWGKRNGYTRTLHCEAGPFVESDDFGTFTGFFTVTLSGK